MIDVLVPAWNEEAVLRACLLSVLRDAEGVDLRVVVAANGCTDATAAVARSCAAAAAAAGHDLRVLELPAAGKTGAVAAAEEHARGGSLLVLDADAVLAPGALRDLDAALDAAPGALLAAPRRVALVPEHPLSRGHHLVWRELPGVDGVVGGGAYAVNAAGRRRWGAWPAVTNDDAFVRSRFTPDEQVVLASAYLVVSPDGVRDTAAVLARWRSGNEPLAGVDVPSARTATALARRPRLWRHLPAFAALTAASSVLAHGGERWARDAGARAAPTIAAAPARPRVHVVVVTHDSAPLVLDALDSVRSRCADVVVTVVDNASADGTAELVRRERPDVEVVANTENTGFGAAVNQVAGRVGSDHLLLLNPDAVLEEDALDQLLAMALRLPASGLVGGRAEDSRGRLDPTSCLAAPSLREALSFALGLSRTRLNPDALGGWRRDDARRTPVLTGAVLLVATPLWERLGGFAPRYVLYGEDVDLCVRARRLGASPVFTPLVRYRHVGGASSSPARRWQAILRGRATLADEHLGGMRGRLAQRLLVAGALLRAAVPRPGGGAATWKSVWRTRATWSAGY